MTMNSTKMSPVRPKTEKISCDTPGSAYQVADRLYFILKRDNVKLDDLAIICIGTDRSTGDALGPLVGTKLSEITPDYYNIKIQGTLNSPVHATNMQTVLSDLQELHTTPYIIAIDASLGKHQNIGTITVKDGPLKPGAGVNKSLPTCGNCHVTGIVNVAGFMEYLVLQNTRLSQVMKLSRVITRGIKLSLDKASVSR